MPRISLQEAEAAKKAAARRFQSLVQLSGVGITRVNGEYAVKLNLSEALPTEAGLPTEIDGVPLKVEVVGRIRPR